MINYQVKQVDRDSWIIQEEQVRCFLFVGTERALLVDSGMELDDLRGTVESLTRLPVTLVNTHTDHDHISCNDQFEQVYMHPAEFSFYHQLSARWSGLESIWDGDQIDLGGRVFQVILTPGHTPGSIALLDETKRILVGGDGIQDGTIYMYGAQRDLSAYIRSLEMLQSRYSSQFDLVFPSHATCPVSSSIILDLLKGAKRIQSGNLEGTPVEVDEPGVIRYDMGVAKMLYCP